jgi:histidine triad (HIT) family protein
VALTDWYCDEVLQGMMDVDRVFEDRHVLAFHHPRPSARPHAVVIPKSHVPARTGPDPTTPLARISARVGRLH